MNNTDMTTKKKLIAGNWKMNGSLAANEALPKSFSIAADCSPV